MKTVGAGNPAWIDDPDSPLIHTPDNGSRSIRGQVYCQSRKIPSVRQDPVFRNACAGNLIENVHVLPGQIVDLHMNPRVIQHAVEQDRMEMNHPAVRQGTQQADGPDPVSAAPEDSQRVQLMAGVLAPGERTGHQRGGNIRRGGAKSVAAGGISPFAQFPEASLQDVGDAFSRQYGNDVFRYTDLSECQQRIAYAFLRKRMP